MQRKQLLIYAFIVSVLVFTACSKTESDKNDKLVTVEREDKLAVTKQDDKEEPGTTGDSELNAESQDESGKTPNTPDEESNTSTNVEDKTDQNVTSGNTETDSSTQEPTTTPDTTNPSTDSNNTDSSPNNSVTDSQLKAEADTNASKYMSYYQEVLRLVNEIRAEAGVGPLTLDMTLCKAASMRAVEMDYNNVMSHTRPDGSDCWTVLDSYGVSYSTCGENIAAGYSSAAAVVNAWKNSPSHYENMITPSFTKLGVGYSMAGVGDYGYYWCQVFTN